MNRPLADDPPVQGMYVYVIQSRDFRTGELRAVKVGKSYSPGSRLASVIYAERRAGNWINGKLVHSVRTEDADGIEMLAHRILEKYSCGGEWFECDASTAIAAIEKAMSDAKKLARRAAWHERNARRKA